MNARPYTAIACLALLCLSALAATPAGAADKCHEDGDCSGVLLCRQARCVAVQCRNDSQCPAGRMCRDELCRIRQCYRDGDCSIDRRCDAGSCVIPPPPMMKEAAVPGVLRITAGPFFPLGLHAQVDVPLGANRWVVAGVGTTVNDGGLSWRLGLRGAPVTWEAFEIDAWAGMMGLNVSAVSSTPTEDGGPPPADAFAALLGSGRFLFDGGRAISAMWWGAGVGIAVPHGPKRRRTVRFDLGALLLFDDRSPAERDFALLPAAGFSYGWALPPDVFR